MIKFSLAVLANRMTSCDYIGLVHNMSCDWSLIGSILEPIRISHVIQNIIMVIIFEYIIYIEFGYIEIIMYSIHIQYNNTIFSYILLISRKLY